MNNSTGEEKLSNTAARIATDHVDIKKRVVVPAHLHNSAVNTQRTEEETWTAMLEEQSRFIRLIIDSSPVAILIYDVIKERNVFASREVEKLTGYSPYEIKALGSNMLRTLAHPDDLAEQQRLLRQITESNSTEVQDVTYRIVCKDGRLIHANARRSVFKRSASGKPTELIVILNDVTARLNAEKEMALKNEELELKTALFERAEKLANSGAYTWDMETNEAHFTDNLFRLFGVDPQGMKSTFSNIPEFVHPDDREASLSVGMEFLKTGKPYCREYRVIREDGELRHFKNINDAMITTSGKKFLMGVTQDITDEKLLAERERESELKRQKEILNAIVAAQEKERVRIGEALHDGVAQLLYGVQTRVQALDKNPSPQNVQDILSIVNEAICETRNITFELVPVVLKDYGVEVALRELFKRIVKDLSLEFTFVNSCRLPEDTEFTLYRIVQELFSNIVRHSGADKAWIRIKCNNRKISLLVIDNGKGFDEEKISREHKGIGLQNIRNRLSLLEGAYQLKTGPKGTLVAVSFPAPEQETETCGKPHISIFRQQFSRKK